jgi:hypothetical protein
MEEDGQAAPEVVNMSLREMKLQNKEKRDAAHAAKAQKLRQVSLGPALATAPAAGKGHGQEARCRTSSFRELSHKQALMLCD